MNEKELIDALEKAVKPMHEAHQEFLKTTMDIVHNAFSVGVEVGKALQDNQAGIDEAVEKLQKEFSKHNVYPMTWEQESKTFADGVLHAIKALQDNK